MNSGSILNLLLSTTFFNMALIALVMITLFAVLGVVLVLMERKVAAFMQLRPGPNRVGYKGSAQTIADTIKLVTKERLTPIEADKMLFNLAPIIVLAASMLAMAPIAFAAKLQIWDLNIGIFYILAMTSMGVIGILFAGWSSGNKYSLLGAMRSGAQIVSYELSIGLAVVAIAVLVGSLQISEIIESQRNGWWLFKGHIFTVIAFVIFIIASTAELNRAPFDLPEAESELTAGFHTEYSGIQFAFFFLAEYVNLFIAAAVASTLFLGGWLPIYIPNLHWFNEIMAFIPPVMWFILKTFFIIFLIMWFRWTFPRLRIDQLLRLEWKYLLPISIINVVIIGIMAVLGLHF